MAITPSPAGQLDVLLQVAGILEELGVAFHVGGSFASSVHGEPRQTRGIDLVAALTEDVVGALCARLGESYYADEAALRRAVRERRAANLVHLASGVKVDLFVRGDAPFDRSEFERAAPVALTADPARSVRVKTAEDTVLRKLLWYRDGGGVSERQWRDVVSLFRTQGDRLDREYLERWGADLGLTALLVQARSEAEDGGR